MPALPAQCALQERAVRVVLQLGQILRPPAGLDPLGERGATGARGGRAHGGRCVRHTHLRSIHAAHPTLPCSQAYSVRVSPSGTQATPTLCSYNLTSKACVERSPPGALDHVLVQPRKACRGVEEWRTDECQREAIWCAAAAARAAGWAPARDGMRPRSCCGVRPCNPSAAKSSAPLCRDASYALLTTGTFKGTKAMAINCAGRRGQHQVGRSRGSRAGRRGAAAFGLPAGGAGCAAAAALP